MTEARPQGALAGLRGVELARILAGPWIGQTGRSPGRAGHTGEILDEPGRDGASGQHPEREWPGPCRGARPSCLVVIPHGGD